MGGYNNFYKGADYGFEAKYDDEFLGMDYRAPAGNVSLATNPFTANQLQEVTTKLNTGAKSLEVNMAFVDPQQGAIAESIPNQHLEELNRLRKLVGAEFTVHGALIEPTGIVRNNWDDTHRQQAERQMWTSLERAKLVVGKEEKNNVVVTFHSSNGLPEPETFVVDERTGQPVKTGIWVVDERTGQFSSIPARDNPLLGKKADPYLELEEQNKKNWETQLSQAAFHAHAGSEAISNTLRSLKDKEMPDKMNDQSIINLYKDSKTETGRNNINNLSPETKKALDGVFHDLNYGESHVNSGYNDLQTLFNQAWSAIEKDKKAKPEDMKKLERFREEVQKNQEEIGKDLNKRTEIVLKGFDVLNSITAPNTIKPLKEFAIDKASDTFSNLAMRSYNKFHENSPVISIENPPAGSGLNRAEDIKALIEMSRDKFVEKAKAEGMSESQAKENAEKIIGATWDLGHINMIRKFGFDEKQLEKETKAIAPYVKNIHLSDNFGMEHTELPMGMGNVPTKMHLNLLNKYNDSFKKLKQVIEAGNWYTQFKTTPFGETLSALGSPIYSMQLAPAWNQTYGRTSTPYFAGYGLNPEIHHSIYGAGFTTLPLELGGQVAGRSRFSGTAME